MHNKTLGRASEVGGKVGLDCLRFLGSLKDCDQSLEFPRRHHVEVDLAVALSLGQFDLSLQGHRRYTRPAILNEGARTFLRDEKCFDAAV
jgi:hypothetical protein